jgi:pSer/pThr/pTyr-binding forkhead associated (FHA) protein
MVNSNSDVDSALTRPHLWPNSGELEQRISLYQVFLRVYEHHRELLDEILDLENTDRHRMRGVWQYIQAGVEADKPYIITNLLQGKTLKLIQPQNCWVLGRDPHVGLSVQDKRLSRRHALIQYVAGQGFYLKDLASTNGTFLNGEPVRHSVLLKDGDRIRVGSLFFTFFVISGCQTLMSVTPDYFVKTAPTEPDAHSTNVPAAIQNLGAAVKPDEASDLATSEKETFLFPSSSPSEIVPGEASDTPDLSTAQKANILERFLDR